MGIRTPEEAMTPEQRILRTPEAAQYLGLAKSTLEKHRLTGSGPKFIRLGLPRGSATKSLHCLGSRIVQLQGTG
jgi:hypothetical protein